MGRQLPDGVRLLRTLIGPSDITDPSDTVGRIGWSPDGRLLATPSTDETIRVWDADSGMCVRTLRGHAGGVFAAAFDLEGRILATCGHDGTRLWDVASGKLRTVLGSDSCFAVAFRPDNRVMAIASDAPEVILWRPFAGSLSYLPTEKNSYVFDVAFDVDGGLLATGSRDHTIMLWDMVDDRSARTLYGHSGAVNSVVFHPDGGILASAGGDRTIRLWDLSTDSTILILEGHTDWVRCLSFFCDGRLLASNSTDGTVRLWETESGRCVAILPALASKEWTPSVAFHPHLPILAAVGSDGQSLSQSDSVVQLWELDVDRLLAHAATSSVSYTTAKIVLVGESGVGKTGLGWRLAHGEFVEHSSTHGQQFWLLDELCGTAADGTERAAILWDLAGQPDYRLIHALYLNDADLALVLFDPTRGDEPLRGVEYWLRQLGHDRPIILVAARGDRGAPRLTTEEIEAFCVERGIAGYVATSAVLGDGLDELIERMRAAIRWDGRPTTVTTRAFKRIKDFVLRLKETPRAEDTILSVAELRTRLAQEYACAEFTTAELQTAVQHLSNHGYVSQLRTSRGESRILLAPVLLNNLAASMVLEARRNPRGLGSLEEQKMLTGGHHFPELAALSAEERGILLDSAVAMFLAHSVCLRETSPLTTHSYLVFPELINLRKPVIADEQSIEEGVAYTVSGAVGNVYASLVVLLGYTSTFTRTDQWRDHARYIVGDGLVCGLRQEAEREGELDFVLYFGATVETPIRTLFQSLFESFLSRRELTVRRYEVVRCTNGHQLNRAVVRERLAEGANHAFCPGCGQRVALPPSDTPIVLTQQQEADLADQRRVADQRSRFEQVLFRLTTYVTQEGIPAPDCFISYAWGDAGHEHWVEHELATDLAKAGITVILDRWENERIGASVHRYVERIARAERVVVVGTPLYRTKYDNNEPSDAFVVAAEGDLIGRRMLGSEADKESVLPILLDGTSTSSFPPLLQGRVYADFRLAQRYLQAVFDLIVSLYQISSREPVRQLRHQLDESR
ncbi:MAG TPA: TIR domain-containing protein [Pseudonocardiaceae bacterium]|nr:TIR domain-containing protein [Pseudonocardiaceae bacterium]